MNTLNFKYIFLGQSVLKYQVPLEIFYVINSIYENKYPELKPANKQLVGKIEKEHSLFYDGADNSKMINHNHLTQDVLMWFEKHFKHYLDWNNITGYKMHLNSVWVNTMFENEYNPVHVHQGSLFTGLSSVMILKLPKSYGVEYSAEGQPQNGKLQILGSASGQFSHIDYQPNICNLPFCGKAAAEYSTPKLSGNFKIITLDNPVYKVPWCTCTGLYSCSNI